MSVLDKLIDAHSPIGFYSITEGSNIYSELKAYAAGLEYMQEDLDVLCREMFPKTADAYGLAAWEKIWGAARADLPLANRREMILARLAFGYDDFTPEGMAKVLKFLGIEGTVKEYPNVFRVTVEFPSQNLTQGMRNWIVSQLQAIFPAHIEADAVFAGFDWNTVEGKELTFDSMQNKAMRWSEIDIYVV